MNVEKIFVNGSMNQWMKQQKGKKRKEKRRELRNTEIDNQ